MNRRHFVRLASGAALSAWGWSSHLGAAEPARTGLGLVAYCQSLRQKQMQQATPGSNLLEPFTFLRHCDSWGAGGMQVSLGVLSPDDAAKLRDEHQQRRMFLEAIISLPKTDGDLERFQAEMQSAAAAGARAVRCVIIPGRRYEQFQSLDEFRAAEKAGRAMLERAAQVAEALRLPLAVENHKDQRNAERVRLFESISSEYVGACVDTGNSLALLEDPLETVRALAPWAQAVHLKDQALQPADDGFLLADIPLGEGCLDLAAMIRILREHKPDLPMALELITRDPLRVPCLAESYWRTFPDLPARDLARTLRLVRERAHDDLPEVSHIALEEQTALETENVRSSLAYARDVLKL